MHGVSGSAHWKMAALISRHSFFEDQSPPSDLEEAQRMAKHFAEANLPKGRPVVLVTVSNMNNQSLPSTPSQLRSWYSYVFKPTAEWGIHFARRHCVCEERLFCGA